MFERVGALAIKYTRGYFKVIFKELQRLKNVTCLMNKIARFFVDTKYAGLTFSRC